jgi:YVTN family beta-propeller protein
LSDTNSVIVIDTNTLSVIKTIPIGSVPIGLAVSADNSKLWIGNSGSTNFAIGVIDLDTLTALSSMSTPVQPYDVVEGLGHRLYLTPAVDSYPNYGIMQVDSDTGQYQGSLGSYEVYAHGNLEVTPDRKTLLFGNSGLSPSTMDKFDISTATGVLRQSANLGSNGNSITVSHSGAYVVYPNGAGNRGYGTYEIPTADITTVNGTFNVGAYPGPAAFSNDDTLLYHSAYGTNRISTFETCFCTLLGTFNLNSNDTSDIVVDRSGQWLFVATRGFGSPAPGDIRVFSTGRTDPVRPFAKTVVSRKTHGTAGTFDINLPTACTRGIECRNEGSAGTHHIVFRFAGPISVNGATVAPSPGGTAELDGTPIMNTDNTEVTVNLTNVSNAQQISVVLNGVNDGTSVGDVPLTMGILVGDVNGNGVVSNSDVASVKAQVAAAVTSSNFRNDISVNGIISNTDVSAVKAQAGTTLP